MLAGALLRAFDPDAIAERASGRPGADPADIPADSYAATQAALIEEACAPFDRPELRHSLETLKRETEQILDIYTPDEVLSQGFDEAARAKALGLVQEFRDYLAAHKAQIDALQILYSRPYGRRLTEDMLKVLEAKLKEGHAAWTEDRLWDAFVVATPERVRGRTKAGRFADLVALVRFALEQQELLTPFADSVAERFGSWLKEKTARGVDFTLEQLDWLTLIRDHIATSLSIELEDFEYGQLLQRGGLGKAHLLFGEGLEGLIEELNDKLVA
jgi:type I restriction enzyme R subunit